MEKPRKGGINVWSKATQCVQGRAEHPCLRTDLTELFLLWPRTGERAEAEIPEPNTEQRASSARGKDTRF